MNSSERMRQGIERASKLTGISARQASIKAGFNEAQLNRFMKDTNNIKLVTLDKICQDGFGMTFDTVYTLGEK